MSLRKLLVAALLATTAQAAVWSDSLVKEFEARPGERLVLDMDEGGVTVDTWDREQVRVEIGRTFRSKDRADQERILKDWDFQLGREDGTVRVKVSRERQRLVDGLDLDFRITVPRSFSIELETGGGQLEVGALKGAVRCRTAGGVVTLGPIDGTVDARTAGGEITLESCSGDARLETAGGDVNAGANRGSLRVETSGGNIRLEGCEGPVVAHTAGGNISLSRARGSFELETAAGNVDARLEGRPTASSIRTAAGNIQVELASGIACDLDARTSAGTIDTSYPIHIDGEFLEYSAKGPINGGGPALVLRTAAGNIGIEPAGGPREKDSRVQ